MAISYENTDNAFTLAFSRVDRNISPLSSQKDGQINGQISEIEQKVLKLLRDNPAMTNAELITETGKAQRTITRTISTLKGKGLISRVGSNRNGYWQVK